MASGARRPSGGETVSGCEREGVGGVANAVRVCRERGWAVVFVPGEGLRPCDPDEHGAYADLDRYRSWLADFDR